MTDETSRSEESPYLEAFVDSTVETLRTMAMLETSCVRRCRESECGLGWEVGAQMELTGENKGCAGVATSMECARKIVSYIVGHEMAEVSDDDACGGMAEVLNMIAGNAKARLVGTPHHFELTTPLSWTGKREALCRGPEGGATAIFEIDGAQFAVCADIS